MKVLNYELESEFTGELSSASLRRRLLESQSSKIFISPVAVKEEQYFLQFVSFEGSRCNTVLSIL